MGRKNINTPKFKPKRTSGVIASMKVKDLRKMNVIETKKVFCTVISNEISVLW